MNGFLTGDFSFRSNTDPPSSPELIPVADPNEVRFGQIKGALFQLMQCVTSMVLFHAEKRRELVSFYATLRYLCGHVACNSARAVCPLGSSALHA